MGAPDKAGNVDTICIPLGDVDPTAEKLYRSEIMFIIGFKVSNEAFSVCKIKTGIPKGSNLGPLPFIIYMDNSSKTSDLLFKIIFADDTNVLLDDNSYHKVILELNCELKVNK